MSISTFISDLFTQLKTALTEEGSGGINFYGGDYTTRLEWVIPRIEALLSVEKYQIKYLELPESCISILDVVDNERPALPPASETQAGGNTQIPDAIEDEIQKDDVPQQEIKALVCLKK